MKKHRWLPMLLGVLLLLTTPVAAEDTGSCYFYTCLSPDAREIYDLLEESGEALRAAAPVSIQKSGMNVTQADAYATEMNRGVDAFVREHPQVFWLGEGWSWQMSGMADVYTFTLSFSGYGLSWSKGGRSLDADIQDLTARAEALASEARSAGESRCSQLAYVHDWLTTHNLYNSEAFDKGMDRYGDSLPWTALAALDPDQGPVCEGYSKGFKLVCDLLEIPCVIVKGTGHAWNYVCMEDGAWYAVDVTWDDPVYRVNGKEVRALQSGGESREYFLRGADNFSSKHRALGDQSYPTLSRTDFSSPDFPNTPPPPVPTPAPTKNPHIIPIWAIILAILVGVVLVVAVVRLLLRRSHPKRTVSPPSHYPQSTFSPPKKNPPPTFSPPKKNPPPTWGPKL